MKRETVYIGSLWPNLALMSPALKQPMIASQTSDCADKCSSEPLNNHVHIKSHSQALGIICATQNTPGFMCNASHSET